MDFLARVRSCRWLDDLMDFLPRVRSCRWPSIDARSSGCFAERLESRPSTHVLQVVLPRGWNLGGGSEWIGAAMACCGSKVE